MRWCPCMAVSEWLWYVQCLNLRRATRTAINEIRPLFLTFGSNVSTLSGEMWPDSSNS